MRKKHKKSVIIISSRITNDEVKIIFNQTFDMQTYQYVSEELLNTFSDLFDVDKQYLNYKGYLE